MVLTIIDPVFMHPPGIGAGVTHYERYDDAHTFFVPLDADKLLCGSPIVARR